MLFYLFIFSQLQRYAAVDFFSCSVHINQQQLYRIMLFTTLIFILVCNRVQAENGANILEFNPKALHAYDKVVSIRFLRPNNEMTVEFTNNHTRNWSEYTSIRLKILKAVRNSKNDELKDGKMVKKVTWDLAIPEDKLSLIGSVDYETLDLIEHDDGFDIKFLALNPGAKRGSKKTKVTLRFSLDKFLELKTE